MKFQMKVLFLCTGGNSCRSLMAEAFLQHSDPSLEVFSAGINPDDKTDLMAIKVMQEIGIDISDKNPKSYKHFEGAMVDYLITISDGTKDKTPPVNISYKHKIQLGFNDPRKTSHFNPENADAYRETRDEIRNELDYFYSRILSRELVQ